MVRGCRTAMKETDDENLVIHRLFNFYLHTTTRLMPVWKTKLAAMRQL